MESKRDVHNSQISNKRTQTPLYMCVVLNCMYRFYYGVYICNIFGCSFQLASLSVFASFLCAPLSISLSLDTSLSGSIHYIIDSVAVTFCSPSIFHCSPRALPRMSDARIGLDEVQAQALAQFAEWWGGWCASDRHTSDDLVSCTIRTFLGCETSDVPLFSHITRPNRCEFDRTSLSGAHTVQLC